MTETDLCFTPATELVALIRRRKVSPLPPSRRRSRGRIGGRPSGDRQFPVRLSRPSTTGAIVPRLVIASSTRSPS